MTLARQTLKGSALEVKLLLPSISTPGLELTMERV